MRDDQRLYQEIITDHYRFPRNQGHLDHPDFSSDQHNPSCGDRIQVEGRIVDDRLVEVAFVGSGCIISQATASMVTEAIKGKTIAEIRALRADFVTNLLGVQLGPMRLKCALIALSAIQDGLKQYVDAKNGGI